MMATKTNPGEGELFYFHGAFNQRSAALAKKTSTPGSFVRPVYYRGGMRYAVLTPNRDTEFGFGANENPDRRPVVRYNSKVYSYFSNLPAMRPKGPKVCRKCGSKKNIRVNHKNGDPTDIRRSNHEWLCNSCNQLQTGKDARLGRGKKHLREWNKDRPKVGTLVMMRKIKTRKPATRPFNGKATLAPVKRKAAKKAAARRRRKVVTTTTQPQLERLRKNPNDVATLKQVANYWQRKIAGELDAHYYDAPAVLSPRVRKLREANTQLSQVLHAINTGKVSDADQVKLKVAGRKTSKAILTIVRNPRKKAAAKKAKRHNPDHRTDRQAKRVVKRFIGRATGKATKARHPGLKQGTTLANLKMRLDYLKLKHPDLEGGMIRFAPKERPLIASTPDGRQYHFIGGKQNLDVVPALGKQNPGGLRDLGEVVQLGYTARKHVDDFRKQAYFHNLGEENGKRPRLFYDPKQKQMYFVGGDYRTRAEGITN